MDDKNKNQEKENQEERALSSQKKIDLKSNDAVAWDEDSNPKGAYLKELRIKKGIPLETVHEETKIPMDALRAIEEGYTVRILTPFYVKGFLKIYAKYLDVDVEKVIEGYKKEQLPKYIKPDHHGFDLNHWMSIHFTRKQKQRLVVIIGFLLAFFLVFKVTTFIVRGLSRDHGKKIQKKVTSEKDVQGASNVVTKRSLQQKEDALASIKVIKTVEPKKRASAPVKVSGKMSSQNKTTSASSKVTIKTAPIEAKKAPQSNVDTAIKAVKDVTLTVRAQKDSWLRVKMDGKIVFQSTLKKGSVETWMADKSVEITGKNIYLLEFELNGKMIGTLGKKDRRAKGIVVTKDGLSVTK